MSTRDEMIEKMAQAMFNSGCRAPLVGTPWRDNYTAEYWRKKAEIALKAIADVPPVINSRLEPEEIHRWACVCGYPSPDHALYCSQCGASRTGPIQVTAEELADFLQDARDVSDIRDAVLRDDTAEAQRIILENLKRHFPSPAYSSLSLNSRVIYRGSYSKYRDQQARVIHPTSPPPSSPTHATVEFEDGNRISVLRSVLEVLAD